MPHDAQRNADDRKIAERETRRQEESAENESKKFPVGWDDDGHLTSRGTTVVRDRHNGKKRITACPHCGCLGTTRWMKKHAAKCHKNATVMGGKSQHAKPIPAELDMPEV
jgi:hypothetical protein